MSLKQLLPDSFVHENLSTMCIRSPNKIYFKSCSFSITGPSQLKMPCYAPCPQYCIIVLAWIQSCPYIFLMWLMKMDDMDSVLSYLVDISTSWGVWLHVFFYRKSIKVGSDYTTLSGWPHCLHVHEQRERRPVPDETNNRYLPSLHN